MNLTVEPAGMVQMASTFAHLVTCRWRHIGSGSPRRSGKRAQDVQPPDHERPREWDGLQALSWLIDVLGMELVGFVGLYQFDCVVECRRPVEPAPKCLADEGP